MPSTTSDLFHKAQSHRNSSDEVDRRIAVHLAYYAAYHDVTGVVAEAGEYIGAVESEDGGKHARLINRLKKGDHHPKLARDCKAMGRMLHGVRGTRVTADYYLNEPVTSAMVDEHIASVFCVRSEVVRLRQKLLELTQGGD